RRIVKDYFMICDSYYDAIRTATPDRIEAIDMGRRSLHDEGSQLLMERLKNKVTVDFETARRRFALLCVLHWKGGGVREPGTKPRAVLFACGQNSVRSPMAAALMRQAFGK